VRYLIDNDVFFAAIYRKHANHRLARKWLDRAKPEGWGIAVETYLAALRLFLNPAVMGDDVLTAATAFDVIDAELSGPHPGQIVTHSAIPQRKFMESSTGHRQIMDCWLIQLAESVGAKLATCDRGIVTHWPYLSHLVK